MLGQHPLDRPPSPLSRPVASRRVRPLLGADRLASAVFDALLIVGHELAAPGQAADVIVAVPEEGSLRSECAGTDFAESILTARKRERIARVVVASSLAAVGPLGPGRDLRFEGEPARPTTSEGRAFLALEQRLLEIRDEEKFELVILRGGPLFDDEEGGALEAWLGELAANPDVMAQSAADDAPPYLHREDLALGVSIAAAEGDWIYHLGDNVCPTIGELAQQFLRAFPGWFPGPSVPVAQAPRPERCHWRFPNHRAEREFEYQLHRRLPAAAEGIATRARARVLQQQHGDLRRPTFWKGRFWRLLEVDRAGDLARGIATLHDAEDPSQTTVLSPDLFGAIQPAAPTTYALRPLLEETWDLGFSDRWIGMVLDFAGRQGMLRPANPDLRGKP